MKAIFKRNLKHRVHILKVGRPNMNHLRSYLSKLDKEEVVEYKQSKIKK